MDKGEENFTSKTQLRLGLRGSGVDGAEAGVGWRSCRVFARTLGSIPRSEETKRINQNHKREEVLKLERMERRARTLGCRC